MVGRQGATVERRGARKRVVLGLVGGAVVGLVAAPTAVSAAERGSTNFIVEAPRQVSVDANPLRLYVQPQVAVDPDDPSVLAL